MTNRIFVAFALVLSMPLSAFSATIFSEDYEVTTVSDLTAKGWEVSNNTDANGQPVLAIVDAPSGRTGKVLRMQYFGEHVDDCCNASITRTFAGVSEYYERYYVRYDVIDPGQPTGFSPITAKQHYWNVGDLPNSGIFFLFGSDEMAMGNQTSTTHQCPSGVSDVTCNMPPNLATVHHTYGTWRCVEAHASPTSLDLWVDGVQTLHYAPPQWVAPSDWNLIQVYRQGSDNQYRYEDDYVAATTRIGCAGGGGGGSTAGGGLDF